VKNIFVILSSKEKSKVIKIIFLDILMSILDISFLAMLLFVIKFYTQEHLVSSFNFPINFINKNPLSLVIIFFIFFSLKNYFGFYVIRMQLKFIYEVASRLSQKNITNYLNGNYTDYVSIDSSVHIRRISQQPIEFCHYVLGGFQQIVSQSLLILVTIFAIVIYDPVLFPLLFFYSCATHYFDWLFNEKKIKQDSQNGKDRK
jgi:hypothetical protein